MIFTSVQPAHRPASMTMPPEQTIADAYIYLLGRMLVIRQEQIDLKESGIDYNVLKYNPIASSDFVNPNLDVAYLEAWIAVDDTVPVILDVPKITDRYYTVQLLDEWGEVIVNINERTMPSRPFGKFALVAPGVPSTILADAARIELHSRKAKLLARIELKDDTAGALRLQRHFTLIPLGKPVIAPSLKIPAFDNSTLLGVEIFDAVDTVCASALDVSPVAAEMQQQARAVAAYAATSREARAKVDTLLRDMIVPEFLEYAVTKSAPYHNHWLGGHTTVGNYFDDYRRRTVANLLGIWANTSNEVMYFMASYDAAGYPLDGSNRYMLHFPADHLPQRQVQAYWSVVLVSVPDYRVIPNPINRYNFNSYSPLATEPDGSLNIVIAPEPLDYVPESNWLPSPEGQAFALTFRCYVPGPLVKRGEWSPPPVMEVVHHAAVQSHVQSHPSNLSHP